MAALTALYTGDRAFYEECCRLLVQGLGDGGEVHLQKAAAAWIAHEHGEPPPEQLAAALTAAAANAPDHCTWAHLLGALRYRQQHDLAAQTVRDAIKMHGREGVPEDWLFLAMIHTQTGDAESARQRLGQFRRWSAQSNAQAALTPLDELRYELLHSEAEGAFDRRFSRTD